MDWNKILYQTYFGNTLGDYLWSIGIILAGLIFKKLISKFLSKLIYKAFKKYSTGVDVSAFNDLLIKPISVFILLISLYLAQAHLEFPRAWHLTPPEKFGFRMIMLRSFLIVLVISITWIILRIVDFFTLVLTHRASLTESKTDDQLIPFIKEALKIVVFIFSFFFIMGAVFNLNITSLIAGLGIGGLAIALAAKESLENLFGSFTIFLDKPFVLGDLVQVGNVTGNVEKIGFRSTRIRTLEKSFVTVPNKKMIDAELDNLTLRIQRRVKFTIGLTYDTSAEKIKSIVEDIRNIFKEHPHIDHMESRVIFDNFGTSSLDIVAIYYINTTNPEIYLAVKEEINFTTMALVESHNCKFAFPTSTIHLIANKDA